MYFLDSAIRSNKYARLLLAWISFIVCKVWDVVNHVATKPHWAWSKCSIEALDRHLRLVSVHYAQLNTVQYLWQICSAFLMNTRLNGNAWCRTIYHASQNWKWRTLLSIAEYCCVIILMMVVRHYCSSLHTIQCTRLIFKCCQQNGLRQLCKCVHREDEWMVSLRHL